MCLNPVLRARAIALTKFQSQCSVIYLLSVSGIISQTQPVCIVMELMELGDLKTFLRRHRDDLEEPLKPLTDSMFLLASVSHFLTVRVTTSISR